MFCSRGVLCRWLWPSESADWYYIDADADDAAWFIDNSSVYKTDDAATVLVKINNVEGFTYIYTVRIDRKRKNMDRT